MAVWVWSKGHLMKTWDDTSWPFRVWREGCEQNTPRVVRLTFRRKSIDLIRADALSPLVHSLPWLSDPHSGLEGGVCSDGRLREPCSLQPVQNNRFKALD